MHYPLFRKEDWNGFWALFADNLANMVIISGVLITTFRLPAAIVFGQVLPGLGFTLLVGLAGYVYLAIRLAQKEKRDTVTALPYGISTPVMFVYLYAVMLPVYLKTGDGLLAYRVGLAATLVGGIVEMTGAFIGPWLKRLTPRAGMLGTLAGIAITWIALVPMAIIFEHPLVGLPCLALIVIGLIGRYRLLWGIPAGLLAIFAGAGIGLATGLSRLSFEHTQWSFPVPVFGDLLVGMKALWEMRELFAVIIPLEIYNFIETMNNVESAEAAGDSYPVATCQLLDGAGTCLAALFGAPFPTTVYIGHPAYKQLGARSGYALLTGLAFFAITLSGLMSCLSYLIPEAAVAPLLVFVGVAITHQAFRAIPTSHGIACAFALIPHLANLLYKQLQGTIVGLHAAPLSSQTITQIAEQGIHLQGYEILAQGAILTGLLWGAIVAFLLEGKPKQALVYTLAGFGLTLCGLIHRAELGLAWTPVATGYLIFAAILAFVAFARNSQPRPGD